MEERENKIKDVKKEKSESNENQTKKSLFETFPENLQKIIFNLEENYQVIKKIDTGITLNKDLFKKLEQDILANYNAKEIEFIQSKIFGSYLEFLNYESLLSNFYYLFPEERKDTILISPPEKKNDQDPKTSGHRGRSPPLYLENGEKEAQDIKVESIRETPLVRVAGEIQGEIYKKKIYISKHCLDHFNTLNAKFDLIKEELDKVIYDKIEKHFKVVYNKYCWATPITKEKQAELGVCFTAQMTEKGFLRLFIKKGFNDVEVIIEHYYRIFNFLTYDEHGRLLKLFHISKLKVKAFDYVHLANKVGPKPIIDKDWKGAEVNVVYYSLKNGKTIINVKIDYSDPKQPEIEFAGPKAQCENLRDILVKPAETLPTIDNIGKWSLDARNEVRDVKTRLPILQESITENGQVLLQVQKNVGNYQQDTLAEFSELDARLFNFDLKTDIQHIELKENFKSVLKGVRNNSQNLEQTILLLDNGIQDLKENYKEVFDEFEIDIVTGMNAINKNANDIKKDTNEIKEKLDEIDTNINEKLESLQNFIDLEFKKSRTQFKNNLYLVLRQINELPKPVTSEELQEFLGISKSTLYNYLKVLQDRNLIVKDVVKTRRPGRPANIFTISKKISKKIKKGKKHDGMQK